MKKSKKLLLLGTAITSVVAPVATVISCANYAGSNTTMNKNAQVSHGAFGRSVNRDSLVLTLSNYTLFTSYDKNTGALTIKEGVTEISAQLFQNGYPDQTTKKTELIKSLSLPSSLEKIDDQAFQYVQLTNLTLPYGLTSIGNSAFYSSQIEQLWIPYSVTSIDTSAFQGVSTIANKPAHVTVPSRFQYDVFAIFGASQYDTSTIEYNFTNAPDTKNTSNLVQAGTVLNLSNYKQYTIYNAYNHSLIIKKGINIISNVFEEGYIPDPSKPFATLPIKSLTLPNGVTNIEDEAFAGLWQLTTLNIPNSVKIIGKNAFHDSQLTKLTIPSSVTKIDDAAFASSQLTSLNIPKSVKTIGKDAFRSIVNFNTTNVWIPISYDNVNLKNSIFGKGNWSNISFKFTKDWNPVGPSTKSIILNKSNYVWYTIYNPVTCTLTVREGINEISSNILKNGYLQPNYHVLEPIKTLVLPNSLQKIDNYAFANNKQLTSIKWDTTKSNLKTIGYGAFQNAQLTGDLTIPDSVTTIEGMAFWASPITWLSLGKGVKHIGEWAFEYSKMSTLWIPNGVETIAKGAFEYAPLEKLSIPNSIKTLIGNKAFHNIEPTAHVWMPGWMDNWNDKDWIFGPWVWSTVTFTDT